MILIFLYGDIPCSSSNGVYISQNIRLLQGVDFNTQLQN